MISIAYQVSALVFPNLYEVRGSIPIFKPQLLLNDLAVHFLCCFFFLVGGVYQIDCLTVFDLPPILAFDITGITMFTTRWLTNGTDALIFLSFIGRFVEGFVLPQDVCNV